jgi:hypothetical protein
MRVVDFPEPPLNDVNATSFMFSASFAVLLLCCLGAPLQSCIGVLLRRGNAAVLHWCFTVLLHCCLAALVQCCGGILPQCGNAVTLQWGFAVLVHCGIAANLRAGNEKRARAGR